MTQTQTLLEAIDEVETNINELKEQVEDNSLFSDSDEADDDTDDLPSFEGYDMVEQVTVEGQLTQVYIDEDADVWVSPFDPAARPVLLGKWKVENAIEAARRVEAER